MKSLITKFVFLFTISIYSQADLMIDFLMYDNATPPNNGSQELTFGLDSTATDNIDAHLGEFPVPPDICCGWGGPILCSVFILSVNPNPTWIDYRFGELPYTGVKEHRIRYCSDSSSTVVTIRCNLPQGVSAVLQDIFAGTFINIAMIDSNEYYINDPFITMDLKLVVTYNNVLPVELKSFTGSFLKSTVQLNWKTATETNNRGFEVERNTSLNLLSRGEAESRGVWEKIGFVSGFGTTTEPKSYSFNDKDVTTGKYKYRLKQIDFDGSFTYSNEIEVEVNFTPKEFVLYQNYPNPFNPSTVIKFAIPKEVLVNLSVYNLLGERVRTLINEIIQPGNYDIQFDGSGLTSGVYLYSLTSGSFSAAKKLMLLK